MGSYVHSCGRLSASAESQGRLIHVIDGSGALKPDTESLPNLDHHAHFVACRIHDSEQAMSPAFSRKSRCADWSNRGRLSMRCYWVRCESIQNNRLHEEGRSLAHIMFLQITPHDSRVIAAPPPRRLTSFDTSVGLSSRCASG